MNYHYLSEVSAVLCFVFFLSAVVFNLSKNSKIADTMIFLGVMCLIIAVISTSKDVFNRKKTEVNIHIFKIEDGYHLKCDDEEDLQKIAEALPDIPEAELAKMDFESLSLQKSVDWKVNKIAEEMERAPRKNSQARIDTGYKQIKEISRAELERAIGEYVSRDNNPEKYKSSELKIEPAGADISPNMKKQKLMKRVVVYCIVVIFGSVFLFFFVAYIRFRLFLKKLIALRQRVSQGACDKRGEKGGGAFINTETEIFLSRIESIVHNPSDYAAYHVLKQRDVSVIPFLFKRDFQGDYLSVERFYNDLLYTI